MNKQEELVNKGQSGKAKIGEGLTISDQGQESSEGFSKTVTTESGKKIKTGSSFGAWNTGNIEQKPLLAAKHPLYGLMKSNLDELSLVEYYAMKDYYQLRTSMAAISFTLISTNYYIECESPEIKKAVQGQMDAIWEQLIRSITKAFWAGFSPNAKVFEEDPTTKYLQIKKLRDLSPFMCEVSLDKNDQSFNGFVQKGGSFKSAEVKGDSVELKTYEVKAQKIRPEYAFWYPFMMEEGNYKGQKLLKGAYQPWFFSQVMHLYENKYYQRFGSPLTVGHAPNGYVKDDDGNKMDAQEVMADVLRQIRNNYSVTLPSSRDESGELDWNIRYLESQMRGFDFESYQKRLDMEMSRAVFLPDLMFSSGATGSHKLGVVQKDTFLMLLNAILNDIKFYVDNYIINQFVEFNFPTVNGKSPSKAQFRYEKQGTNASMLVFKIVEELTRGGRIDADVERIGEMVGLPIKQREPEVVEESNDNDQDREPVSVVNVNNSMPDNPFGGVVDKLEGLMEVISTSPDTNDDVLKEIEELKMSIEEKESYYDSDIMVDAIKEGFESSNLYNEVISLCVRQVGRLSRWVEDNKGKSSAKLGYKSSLVKLFDNYELEGGAEVYNKAQNVAKEVLETHKDDNVSIITLALSKALSDLYLYEVASKSPELGYSIIEKLSGALDKAIYTK